MYDNDYHKTVPNWPDLKKSRNVEEGPAQQIQDGKNFETWTKLVKEEIKKQPKIRD